MKTIKSRVAKLEKEVQRIQNRLDFNNRLLDTEGAMTPAEMGRKGGKTKTSKPKGLAAMDPEKRAEIRNKALQKRREKILDSVDQLVEKLRGEQK